MLTNDGVRWNIWESVGFTLDYNEFANKCISSGVAPMDLFDFSTKAGMLVVARATFNLPDDKSNYISIANNTGLLWEQIKDVLAAKGIHVDSSGCGGCGGGQVR